MGKIEKGIESNMVYLQIKELMENARKQVSVKINNILVQTYWKIGQPTPTTGATPAASTGQSSQQDSPAAGSAQQTPARSDEDESED